MKTKQLTINAMLAAMCAVLGYVSLDMGNIKITFESVPVLLAAVLFGPVDGMLVGGVGTLIYQLIRYGVSATTPLWILPYILCGLVAGLWAKKGHFNLGRRQMVALVTVAEFLIFAVNTVVIYLDSKIYGYYSFAYVFGAFGVRFILCIVQSVVFGLALPGLIAVIKNVSRQEAE